MLYATVRQRKIHVKNPTTVIQNGIGVDKLMLSMDEEWLDMDSIVCVFTTKYMVEEEKKEEETEGEQTGETEGEETEKEPTTIMVEKEEVNEMLYTFGEPVLVPWENLKETGTLSVSCTGYVGNEKVMTTMLPDSFWNVVQNGPMTGKEAVEPTPSLYDQIIAASGNAQNAAKLANDVAVELRTAKENGEFDGSDGVTPSIKVGNVLTGAPGSEAQVTRKGTETEAIFDFVIPRGAQGIQGVPGAPGAPGRNGTNGRDGKDGTDGLPGRDGKDGKDAEVTVESITDALGFKPAPDFYTTERVKLTKADGSEVGKDDVDADYILGLYEELSKNEKYGHLVGKYDVTNDDGTFTNRVYTISTGEYNTAGERGDRDTDIKKPKYLVLNCIHGNEKIAAISTYRFFKDLLEGDNVPAQFREGAVFHVMPVGNPEGVDDEKRSTDSGVDLNRNFDYEWSSEAVVNRNPGAYPGSEKETQAIVNWLKANTDAELFIDFHNSGTDGRDENGNPIYVINEVAMVVGLNTEEMKSAKQTALRGLDRVIPFWRDEMHYRDESIFSYSSYYDIPGASVYYATDKLGIPGLCLECSLLQNADTSDYNHSYPFTPETVAAGAEALGNILLEFYEQSGDENHGNEGQFAVADGKGGIKWKDQEKFVHDVLIALMSFSYAKYNTIENALAETNATADGKIGAYTDKNGVYQIVLLDEISSAVPIAVTRDCNIQLNGHTISFTASGAYLEVKTASAVSIDGTVVGSKIVTTGITSSVDEQVIRSTGTHLTITGGTYALENVSCKNGRVIRSGNTTTRIDMNGCTVRSAGTGTNVIFGGTMAKGVLSDCTVKVEAENASAQGITVFTDVTMSNCTFDVKATGQGYSAMAVMATNKATININSCNMTADGYGDVMVNGKTEGRFVAAVCGQAATTVNINGGHYKAAREAIVVSGTARIDGGVFEGCQHGGAYLNGVDTKVKNATFRNIAYFGDCGWNDNRFGACYCGDGSGVNATFYKCNFGTDGTSADYGVRTKGTNCNTYISDSKINGNFTYDLSVDAGNNIYIGKNVAYRQDKVQGNINTTTYAGQSFAW